MICMINYETTNHKIMKVIKGFFVLLFVWVVCLYMLFGSVIIHHIGVASKEIANPNELQKYDGYIVKKLKTDLFGNWVIAKKGGKEVVFRCDDGIFKKLSVSESIGN